MPANSLITILTIAFIWSCSSSKNKERFYENEDTKVLSKNNGLKKRLKEFILIEKRSTISRDCFPSKRKKYESAGTLDERYWITLQPVNQNAYREFMAYTKDSITRTYLGYFNSSNDYSVNWSNKIDYSSGHVRESVDPLLIHDNNSSNDSLAFDPMKISYRFEQYPSAKHIPVSANPNCDYYDSSNSLRKDNSCIYSHPVSGLSNRQAEAYCHWLTSTWNSTMQRKGKSTRVNIYLPSEGDLRMIQRFVHLDKYKEFLRKHGTCPRDSGVKIPAIFLNEKSADSAVQKCDTELWYVVKIVAE